jgi:hypothetical protein
VLGHATRGILVLVPVLKDDVVELRRYYEASNDSELIA